MLLSADKKKNIQWGLTQHTFVLNGRFSSSFKYLWRSMDFSAHQNTLA